MSIVALSDVAIPGLMVSQTWPASRETEGKTKEAIETGLAENFFEAFQTVEIPFSGERKAIARLLDGRPLTYCLARVLGENKLNLSDADSVNRKKSIDRVIKCLDDARETGAWAVVLTSGPASANEQERQEGLKRLEESLGKIALAGKMSPEIKVVIEPLDVRAHKKHTLGFAGEAVAMCRSLDRQNQEVGLCFDTAHVLLNEEDPVEALDMAKEYSWEFHFCNCVTDPNQPQYGDHHIPFGPPGVIDTAEIGHIMARAREMGYLCPEKRPSLFCEVFKRDADDPLNVIGHVRNALEGGWEIAQKIKETAS